MDKKLVEPFYIIGISVRTTNENGQAGHDIPALWDDFISNAIMDQIPNKTGNAIYCIYTEYEKDYTMPYTTILGCSVSNLNEIPAGMKGIKMEQGDYMLRSVSGDLSKGIVYDEWTRIWNSDIPRAYTADFELYGEKAKDPSDARVEIYIAVL